MKFKSGGPTITLSLSYTHTPSLSLSGGPASVQAALPALPHAQEAGENQEWVLQ